MEKVAFAYNLECKIQLSRKIERSRIFVSVEARSQDREFHLADRPSRVLGKTEAVERDEVNTVERRSLRYSLLDSLCCWEGQKPRLPISNPSIFNPETRIYVFLFCLGDIVLHLPPSINILCDSNFVINRSCATNQAPFFVERCSRIKGICAIVSYQIHNNSYRGGPLISIFMV